MRIGAKNPRLGRAAFRLFLPLADRFYRSRGMFRADSAFAQQQCDSLRSSLRRGKKLYLGGICASGTHNSGVALVEVTEGNGPRLVCSNEEERFSGERHTAKFPSGSVHALLDLLKRHGTGPEEVDAWFSGWDNAVHAASFVRALMEEAPQSLLRFRTPENPAVDVRQLSMATRAPRILQRQFGREGRAPFIGIMHHDSHAWFAFAVSPFARSDQPVMIAVIDGAGDCGAISLYVVRQGAMQQIRCNDSLYDSLGIFYAVISSTQGGWTPLSSEGRYMGAAAWGNNDRSSNSYYWGLRDIFALRGEGEIYLNRALANWTRDFINPYTPALIRILGEPIPLKDMWNPDAVLSVEKINQKDTQSRLDKAAATQMVFEDALLHVIDYLIRRTGSDQLVLTGGAALNAVANMRLLEHFNRDYFEQQFKRSTRLHLWVPPIPNDAGAAAGAAYMGAYLLGAGVGAPLQHAFYCGAGPREDDIREALAREPDLASTRIGDASNPIDRNAIADLMAYLTAQDNVIALFQGPAEMGPRALGHRSILANPCNPRTRDLLNSKVKFREAIRPLAPMMTREAAQRWFELSDGASDDDYNAYSYMVLTARAKPEARQRIPAVVHADGTGRLQIVREHTDPLTYAYLKALGRRIGVEVAVNTSFNVAGPIAQTPAQAIVTLRRAKGLDALLMAAEEGPVYAVWQASRESDSGSQFRGWLARWQSETGKAPN